MSNILDLDWLFMTLVVVDFYLMDKFKMLTRINPHRGE
ncbi:hypothetical protein BH695_1605 [Microcystis aeruginosa PCC 7806SL]|uniref:Uncharacterized protein n=1 Tax=Microcystis aeruginosa PCC 7806SL TaxID=1903187 RepID=A0AB33BW68_MICA7|nr:hypothetical protein BH695_1605 [Microcystis aeruginosa PCC 7806SL]